MAGVGVVGAAGAVEAPPRSIGDPTAPTGTGVILWFETAQFDSAVARARSASAHVVTDVHVNSNAGHRESWLRDLDGYLVVLAERDE